jgi:hypothetical protein
LDLHRHNNHILTTQEGTGNALNLRPTSRKSRGSAYTLGFYWNLPHYLQNEASMMPHEAVRKTTETCKKKAKAEA